MLKKLIWLYRQNQYGTLHLSRQMFSFLTFFLTKDIDNNLIVMF